MRPLFVMCLAMGYLRDGVSVGLFINLFCYCAQVFVLNFLYQGQGL